MFTGVLADSGAELAANAGLREIRFASGIFAHRAPADVCEDGDEICMAAGEPRFLDAAFATRATDRGNAAAWLEAFRSLGDEAPKRVRGRFVVVLVRPKAREVVLVTDRFATWPVCYAHGNGRFAFSDAANAVPGSFAIKPQAIFDYVFSHVIPAPFTVFEGVTRVLPAHLVRWRNGTLDSRAYWHAHFEERERPNLERSREEFRAILEQSVAREAAGRKIGAYLSGGTDSSTVAGMLAKVSGGRPQTYSMGFDAAGYDEMEYARIAARHFGTDHHEYYVTPDDLLGGIPKVAAHYDQPFGNSSAVPAWVCAGRAKADGLDKMLAGDGGDELFGGNTRYAKQKVFGWYDGVPAVLRRNLLEPVAGLRGVARIPLLKKAASYVQQARVPMPDRTESYNLVLRVGPATMFERAFLDSIDLGLPLAQAREVWAQADAASLVNRMLAFDWKYTLADNDLPKVIGTAQLAGLDVGFPLLSDELLDFSLRLPPEWKVKGLTLRWFFKDALRGFLPDEIITKKKHGFGLPFGVWACEHAPLKALATDALRSFATRGVVRADFVDRLLREQLPAYPGFYGELVWTLMMLELWLQPHAPSWKLER